MQFEGEFETHLTVRVDDEGGLARLAAFAASRGLKLVLIVLDRGEQRSQPMLTWRSRGELTAMVVAAQALEGELRDSGLEPCRIKIEAAPTAAGVPKTDAGAEPGRYFEHHAKLLIPSGSDLAGLRAAAEPHAAHVSRNAFRSRGDGHEERFVTQRCWNCGAIEARRRLATLQAALALLGFPVLEVEQEYVVFDSNSAVDAGWISEETQA